MLVLITDQISSQPVSRYELFGKLDMCGGLLSVNAVTYVITAFDNLPILSTS